MMLIRTLSFDGNTDRTRREVVVFDRCQRARQRLNNVMSDRSLSRSMTDRAHPGLGMSAPMARISSRWMLRKAPTRILAALVKMP